MSSHTKQLYLWSIKKRLMTFQNILYVIEDNILTITINRPSKLNALNADTFTDLRDAFTHAKAEENLKAIIITGSGDKAFVAGADITEFNDLDADHASHLSARGHAIFNTIEGMHVPVIAAVNGFALGGGLELALACHIRVGSENARLGLPEVTLGLIPGYGGTQRLVQTVGKGKAFELIMTADMVDAATALKLNLLNHVVPQEELLPLAKKIATKIGTRGPVAIAKAIKCVNAYYDKGVDGFQTEIDSFGRLFITEDVKEGASAFLEKRKPNFKGK